MTLAILLYALLYLPLVQSAHSVRWLWRGQVVGILLGASVDGRESRVGGVGVPFFERGFELGDGFGFQDGLLLEAV